MHPKKFIAAVCILCLGMCTLMFNYSHGQDPSDGDVDVGDVTGVEAVTESLWVQFSPRLSSTGTTLMARVKWTVEKHQPQRPAYAKLVMIYEGIALVDFPETPYNDQFPMPYWFRSTTVTIATQDFNDIEHNINFSLPNQPVSGRFGFYLARIDNDQPITGIAFVNAAQ